MLDITGNKYNRLVAVEVTGGHGSRALWKCMCDCGLEAVVSAKNLRSGNTKSCGCLKRESTVARNKSNATHGMASSKIYSTWDNMRQRCYNKNHKSYMTYGGRGIEVCERWLGSFENFFSDMGYPDKGLSLDRKETNGNYEPSNCRWATNAEQANNRRNNRTIEFEGRTQTIAAWAKEIGMSRQALRHRIDNKNWSIREALTMKLDHGNGWKISRKSI